MILNDEFKQILALDLDPIKVKLMHMESGEGWSLERTNAVERKYKRFLFLMKMFPNEDTAPMVDVDTFWHYHILDTMKYAADCEQVFGYFLHHFPYVGMRGKEDEEALERMGERMRVVYEETFGESYFDAAPNSATLLSAAYCSRAAYCSDGSRAAYCSKAAYCSRAAYSFDGTSAAYCSRAAYCSDGTRAQHCVTDAMTAAKSTLTSPIAAKEASRFYSERPRFTV
jgi:Glycine-rich domain-containing protein-like